MSEVFFYHVTQRPMVETLRMLAEKSLARGWRVAVRGTEVDRLAHLDEALWMGDPSQFLPHGLAGGPHDVDQPVLLTTGTEAPNGARCVISVSGAEIAAQEVSGLDRACILFDGADGDAVAHARGQWTALTGAGIGAQYWSEESGRWEKKAEREAQA